MAGSARPSGPVGEGRVPPHNEEAEKAVLGAALMESARTLDLCRVKGLETAAFYLSGHQLIYQAIADLVNQGKGADLLTVGELLQTRGQLNGVGGREYLDKLVDSVVTHAYAEHYIDLVYKAFLLRQIMERSYDAIRRCSNGLEEDAENVLSEVEQSIFELSSRQRGEMQDWDSLIKDSIRRIEEIYSNKGSLQGIPTGFADLDKKLMGLKPSEITILAARPSMGKTSLALNIAENIAMPTKPGVQGRPVAVFSLEMAAEQLVFRMLCCRAKVPSHRLVEGTINTVNHEHLIGAASELQNAKIYLDDTAGLHVLDLRSRARRMKRLFGIELIVVDYLQLLHYSQFSSQGRQIEVAQISSALKSMAKELKIPVIVLSQLSRAPETRDRNAVPKLSDLRDSGSIEQDADVVLLLRRPCKYPQDPKFDDKSLAIVDVAKHRNGPTGEVELHFIDELTRFENRAGQRLQVGEPEDFTPVQDGFV